MYVVTAGKEPKITPFALVHILKGFGHVVKGGDVDGAGLKTGEGVGEAMTPLFFAWFTPAAKPDFHAGRTRKNAEMMNELTITPIQGRN